MTSKALAHSSGPDSRISVAGLRSAPYWVQFLVVAAAYYVSQAFFIFQVRPGNVEGAFIFAPIGIGLAALLILGPRIWPAIAVAAFFVHWEGMTRWPFALSSMASNTLEAVLSAFVLRRFTRFDGRMERRSDVLGFAGLSVLLATAISAAVGGLLYCLAGVVPWERYQFFSFLWWRADAMGTLIVAPLILVWSASGSRRVDLDEYVEPVVLAAATLLTSYFVFIGWSASKDTSQTLAYLVFPLFFWAAMRLGQRWTVTVVAVVLIFAAYGTLNGKGPFTASDLTERVFQLFVFVGVSSVSAMLLAATIAEHKASEERFRDLVENARDIIFTTDPEGNITSLNHIGEELSGYALHEALAMNIVQFLEPESRQTSMKMLDHVLRFGVTPIYELEVLTKHGRRMILELRSRAIYRNGVAAGIEAIARDVTERKQLEAQFLHAQKMEAVGRLAAGVAHDFNNLLTIIQGNCELVLHELPAPGARRNYLESVLAATSRAASLTRQLLAFSDQRVVERRILNLNNVLGELQKMLGSLMGDDMFLEFIPGSGLGNVRVDPGLIEQAVVNLIVNARDAMPAGGKLSIETSNADLDDTYARLHPPAVPGRYVMVAVTDTGTGMDEATQARIFEPFFTTKEVGKGTGLGLATVFGIVKQSEGFISVDSKLGCGTTLKLFFPIVEAQAEPYVIPLLSA